MLDPPRPRKKLKGFVYLLESEHGYKIGKAVNLKNRLSTFGLVLPFEVRLVHALNSNDIGKCEWLFHHHFRNQRIKGEWFELSEADIAFFCEAGTPQGIGQAYCVEPTQNLSEYK